MPDRQTWSKNFPGTSLDGTGAGESLEALSTTLGAEYTDPSQINTLAEICETLEARSADAGDWRAYLAALPAAGTGIASNAYTGTSILEYEFDNGASELTDRSSYSHTLTLAAGTERHIASAGGLVGYSLEGSTSYLEATGLTPGVQDLLGADMTFEMLFSLEKKTASAIMFSIGNTSGATANDNVLFELQWTSGNQALTVFHEYGTGSDESLPTTASMPLGVPTLVTVTRDSGNTEYNVYVNGRLLDTVAITNAPTGGSNADIRIGRGFKTAALSTMNVYAVRVSDGEMTALEVGDTWERTRGFVTKPA